VKRYYYSDQISDFIKSSESEIIGQLAIESEFADEPTQKSAWRGQIKILKDEIAKFEGQVIFEYNIPRMGRRIDVVLIIKNVVFVLEFKVGQSDFFGINIDQVWDYALDLKYFHEPSDGIIISPILIATEAPPNQAEVNLSYASDKVLVPLNINGAEITATIERVLHFSEGKPIDAIDWMNGRYSPSPTIIEAAVSLFNNHSVEDIARSDASGVELLATSNCLSEIIERARNINEKAICFLTGVPGSGKTLIGLNVATKELESRHSESSVFLSGNGPLVAILRESLTRDKFLREKEKGNKTKKGEILSSVKAFI